MRELRHALRRNRRLVLLFVLMIVLPVGVFATLIVRAVRTERVTVQFERTARQRQIVRLVEADLTDWLFATGTASARREALLRFTLAGGQIAFPDVGLSLPLESSQGPRPFDAVPVDAAPTAESIATQYYPRIQSFLRDAASGRNAGAQHFLRLEAIIVQPPGQIDGYAIRVQPVVDYLNARLAEYCAPEPFTATAVIAAARQAAKGDGVPLSGFPFFEIGFFDRPAAAGLGDLRRYAFPYSMGLLIVMTVLGSAFLYRAVSQEAQLSKLRNDFVAAVSHEFRSPLSSIVALVERLQSARVSDPAKLQEYHHIIGRDARRLSVLVTRLLDFARIEEGTMVYERERLDLSDAARQAVDGRRGMADASRVACAGCDTPLWIRGDATAVHHAISNLLDNAAKYSPPDAPITVTCSSTSSHHVVSVRDRGAGIPAGERDRIFEKFYRGAQASASNVQGIGIGLALVRHVMEAHGGTVTVDSIPGGGSCFDLRFPRDAA